MWRRQALAAMLAAWGSSALALQDDGAVRPGRVLRWPQDHGAHTGTRIEWWYLTGWLQAGAVGVQPAPRWGFQITFFRLRTGLGDELGGRFAPRQLLFAHAALTDLGSSAVAGSFRHDQRLARWNGVDNTPRAHARQDDAAIALAGWTLQRRPEDGAWQASVVAEDFALDLVASPTQALLLQGEAGFSRKAPGDEHASFYVSQPQLQVAGRVVAAQGKATDVQGRAWLDHEWSDSLLSPGAVGWDWVGINLLDGTALTAFQLRGAAAASPVWAGGSWRPAGQSARNFAATDVRFSPGRRWTSPDTGAAYPVDWQLDTPAGAFRVRALRDAQELDSRASTGTVYWEGLAELLDAAGHRVGLGYLEMTGYAGRLAW
jgi:predicted secreted hydrolase